MIPREKQKAILESMIFISPQPVTMAQMLRRLRSILKSEVSQEGAAETVAGEGVTASGADELIADEAVTADTVSEVDARADDGVAVEADSGSNVVETAEQETEQAFNESDAAGALAQLMHKKQDLENDIHRDEVKSVLHEIRDDYALASHGIELVEVAKGWQFRTKYEIAVLIRDEVEDAPTRLSPSSLEVLSIVAYQQPVTRQKIDEVRGVDSGGVLKTLLEKGFLRLVGRSEEPGKPLIYGTSAKFLEIFGLSSLKDLPNLADLESLQMATGGEIAAESSPEPEGELPTAYFDEGGAGAEDVMAGPLDAADDDILSELDASMKNLKSLEKDIFAPPPSEAPAEATPAAVETTRTSE